MSRPWFARLRHLFAPVSPRNTRPACRRSPGYVALLCEKLEDRTLPAVITWDGGGNNLSWHTAANWGGDVVPTATDDVVINNIGTAGADQTILISSGATAHTITSAEHLRVDQGG